jgi:hypothetical protein
MEALLSLQLLQLVDRVQSAKKRTASRRVHVASGSSSTATAPPPRGRPPFGPVDDVNARWLDLVPIEVDYEPEVSLTDAKEDANVQRLLEAYLDSLAADGVDVNDGTALPFAPEPDEPDTDAALADQRFQDQMRRSPGHVVRYKRGATPLWPLHPAPEIPVPCSCGSRRVFEVQVLSTSLHFLNVDAATPEGQVDAGMNWAAVGAYTCENDCTPVCLAGPSVSVSWEQACVQPDDF